MGSSRNRKRGKVRLEIVRKEKGPARLRGEMFGADAMLLKPREVRIALIRSLYLSGHAADSAHVRSARGPLYLLAAWRDVC
jgi:hypothetical protein